MIFGKKIQRTKIGDDVYLEDGKVVFKSYAAMSDDYGVKEYYRSISDEMYYIVTLGCATKEWDPHRNLAKYLIDWELSEKYEQRIIKKFNEVLESYKQEKIDVKNYLKEKERKIKSKIKLLTKQGGK